MSIDWVRRSEEMTIAVNSIVNGRRTVGNGRPLEKVSPRDGRILCRFGVDEPHVVAQAVHGAKASFEDGRWSRVPVQRRKEVLFALATLIEKHREELALLESLDVGKPIRDAETFDVPAAAHIMRFSAESADKMFGRVYSADPANLSYELKRPVGVVAGIVGWNFPLVLAATKVAPALAVGNSLVLKPSELTSLSAGRLAELALEAGVPEGVLNVVHGDSAVGALLAHHPDIDLITFTGSSQTGKHLMVGSGQSNMKRLILECGGKAPNIVFEDCPSLAAVAESVVARAFWNQGEVCTASSRLLVHEHIKDELLQLVVQKTAEIVPGDPLCPTTRYGALVSGAHKQKVLHYIEEGQREGAKVIYRTDAPAPHDAGFYVNPVIFDGVSPTHRIAREEIFGPVLSVLTFRDEAEAIRLANDTIFGLSAIVWTKDVSRAQRLARSIRAGWIVINATDEPQGGPLEGALPVGGHKESGLGVEGGIEGLSAYTASTSVQIFV